MISQNINWVKLYFSLKQLGNLLTMSALICQCVLCTVFILVTTHCTHIHLPNKKPLYYLQKIVKVLTVDTTSRADKGQNNIYTKW